jgi:phage baseplate assembly protein gpV
MATAPITQLTPDQLYQQITQFQGIIPIPSPFVTINVGTFDAVTAKWTGLTTTVATDPEPMQHEPDQHPTNPAPRYEGDRYISVTINAKWQATTTVVPAPIVQIAPVLLQFTMANTSGPWSVTVNGFTQSAPAGQNTITCNVWDRTIITWSIDVGGRPHADGLRIQRQAGIPLYGAFTIPVIPIAIVYAPPADSQKKSTATYGTSDSIGTSVSYDFSVDSSQTNEPVWVDGAAFKAFLSVVADALGVAGAAAAADGSAAGAAAAKTTAGQLTSASKDITSIGSLLPSLTDTNQQGTVNESGSTVTVTYTQSTALGTTAAGGGPGVGDNIIFYKNVLVAWAYTDGVWQLFPFSAGFTTVTAALLQSQPTQIGISSADAQILLSLDPFVAGGPSASLPSDRFTIPAGAPNGSITYGGGTTYTNSFSTVRDVKETTTTKTYTTDTSSFSPGTLLEMFGVSPQTSKTTTTLTNAVGSDVSSTVSLSVNLVSGPSDLFTIVIWFDNLFGTWAFQQLATTAQPLVSGQGAQPGEVVKLEAGGQVHLSVADSKGNYEFRAANIPPGNAQLSLQGKAPTTVQVPAHP